MIVAETARAKIIRARKEGLRHALRGAAHYKHVLDNLEKMEKLANKEDLDSIDKDRFAMYAALVDKEWRIVDRIMPKNANDESDADSPEDAVSNVHNVIERLIGERVQRSGQTIVPNGSVVPVALRPPKGGSGDTGSES